MLMELRLFVWQFYKYQHLYPRWDLLCIKMQDIQTNYPSNRQKVLYKSLLKTLQQYLMKTKISSWLKNLKLLSTGSISHYSQGKTINYNELQCIICKLTFQNNLAYVLHIQLLHHDKIRIYRYECEKEKTIIYFQEKGVPQVQYFKQDQHTKYYLTEPAEYRINAIFSKIMQKFIKKHKNKIQPKYYHSSDIFKEIGPSSEDEDSETEIGYVQRELQKCRINQFSDVGETDKLLFLHWNDLIHQHKKKQKDIDSKMMGQIMIKFAEIAKRKGIKRVNLLTHTWTLWSFGKVDSYDVTVCMHHYDRYQ